MSKISSKYDKRLSSKLRERFLGAIKFLKRNEVVTLDSETGKQRKQKLFNLPWFIMLGSESSGKSTLLEHSGLKFVLSRKKRKSKEKQLRHCEWWGTKNAIILEINSKYYLQNKNQKAVRSYWNDFLVLLQQSRRPALDGIILNISIETLLINKKEKQNYYFSNLKQRIIEIQKKCNKPVPVYIVFTKLDRLSGFSEFFDSLDQAQRQQIWGIHFQQQATNTPLKLLETFDTEFDVLLKRLNQHLIHRLHQERDQDKRALIKDFPLQIEMIKKSISRLLQHVAEQTTLSKITKIRDIYLTSAITENKTIDTVLSPLNRQFELQPYVPVRNTINKSYFTQQAFKEILQNDLKRFKQLYKKSYPTKNLQRMAVAVAAVFMVTSTIVWSQRFTEHLTQLSQVEEALAQYSVLSKQNNFSDPKQALPALNLLLQASNVIEKTNLPWLMQLGFKDQSLSKAAQIAYQKAVKNIFASELKQAINTELAKNQQFDPEFLYGALKTYIMLGNFSHLDQNKVKNWFAKYWQNNLGTRPEQVKELEKHLNYILVNQENPIDLDHSVIRNARSRLNKLDKATLATAMIANDFINSRNEIYLAVPTINSIHIFTTNKSKFVVPRAHTMEYFEYVYDKVLPAVVDAAIKGNWVIGSVRSNHNYSQYSKLLSKTQARYISEYINTWQNILDQLEIKQLHSLGQSLQVTSALSKPRSEITNFLNIVSKNTSINYHNIPTAISIHFQTLHNFYGGKQQNNLLMTQAHVHRLSEYLNILLSTNDHEKVIFEVTKQAMQKDIDAIANIKQLSKTAPQPINQWLNSLADQTWQILLNQSADYITAAYQQNIMPFYAHKINDHYPINKKSPTEISLKDFAIFFGPTGILSQFTDQYIRDFVDTSSQTWAWNTKQGLKIPLSKELLKQLQIADNIKNIFFDNDVVNTKFSLKTQALQPIVKHMSINIDEQQAVFNKNQHLASQFNWLGKRPFHAVYITMTGIDSTKNSRAETGPWAIFKLIDQSLIKEEALEKQIYLALDLKGYGARCVIGSDGAVNPFSQQLLPSFYLPNLA